MSPKYFEFFLSLQINNEVSKTLEVGSTGIEKLEQSTEARALNAYTRESMLWKVPCNMHIGSCTKECAPPWHVHPL